MNAISPKFTISLKANISTQHIIATKYILLLNLTAFVRRNASLPNQVDIAGEFLCSKCSHICYAPIMLTSSSTLAFAGFSLQLIQKESLSWSSSDSHAVLLTWETSTLTFSSCFSFCFHFLGVPCVTFPVNVSNNGSDSLPDWKSASPPFGNFLKAFSHVGVIRMVRMHH